MVEPARPESAVARFRDRAGAVVGAGFLVGDGLVVTCAHVVAAATGQDEREPPAGPVTVEFPVRGRLVPAVRTATVTGWSPTRADDRGDIAVLRLDGPVPEGVRPATLSPAPPVPGSGIEALGFPADLSEQGLWARGRIRQEQATGWLQIDSVPGAPRISPGFSGTPVFSAAAGGVIGMVVAVVRDAEHTTTFLSPARTLVAEQPALHDAQASPYRGLAPFGEQDAVHFRGRDELIEVALGKARTRPLLVLSGPSGSGKSSLARAGLLPRLRALGRAAITVRVLPEEQPGPLLARITAQLTGGPPGPAGEAGAVAEELTGAGGHVVLVDQFEEAGPATARELAGRLHRLAEATGLLPDGSPRLLVLLTLRGRQLDAVATGETAAAMQAGLVLVAPLTAGQTRAAVTAPGAVFEPGLIERLVTDAGTEPGALPLLGFTLDRLWQRRELGVLTHAGYDELGGVAGAVARYAEGAYERDPARARDLLVLLARPDDDGVFRRRPQPVAELPARLRPALERLIAARLVVIGSGAADEPVAELAHESLIRAWPRLRQWLEQDLGFRTWLEETRRGARRWRETGHDPDALPRGAALSTAAHWAQARRSDLTPDELGFVRAAEAQDRRRARRGRAVTSGLVALTLLAGVFALVARQQADQAGAQVRNAASRQLADDAGHFRRLDPARSLQLSLAAWHAAQTPEAYGALFTEYAALEPVDAFFDGLTATGDDPIEAVSTSRDGSVTAVEDAAGRVAVWQGLAAGTPRRVALRPPRPGEIGGSHRLSPSGRWLAYANGFGGVHVSDLTDPGKPPIDLAPTGPDGTGGVQNVQMIQFAPDDSGLAVLRTDLTGGRAEVRAWDLRTRRAWPSPSWAAEGFVPSAVHFGPVPGSILLSDFQVLASYDLASGRRLRVTRAGDDDDLQRVSGGGALVVTCGRDDVVVVRDAGTGARLRSATVPSCVAFDLDANTEFGVLPGNVARPGDTNASLTVIDPRTAQVHRVAVPPVEVLSGFEPYANLAVLRGPDGPVALLAERRQLYRVPLRPAVTLRGDGGGPDPTLQRGIEVAPDGTRVVIDRTTGRLTTLEARTDRQLATTTASVPPNSTRWQGDPRGITDDSRRMLTAERGELTVRRLPDLTVEHRLDLPPPAGLGGPPADDGFSEDWAASVVPVGAGQAIVLYAGILTRWDVVTGTRLGDPVHLRAGRGAGERRRAAMLAFAAGRRPGHPDQIPVVLPDATVQLWSLDQGRVLATFAVDAAGTGNSVFFHPDGGRLGIRDRGGYLTLWQVADPGRRPREIPIGQGTGALGFTPGSKGYLVTVEQAGRQVLRLWDLDTGGLVAELTAPLGSVYTLEGDEVGVFADGYARRLRLDPQRWFATLCALADRPYTTQEIAMLREWQAPLDRPCG